MEQKKIYIVGAGISGLIAAYELEQQGYQPVILEKSDSVGGRVKTVEVNGFALDLGFQVLLDAYPMVSEYLNKSDLSLKKLAPGAFIYADNTSYLIGDPMRNFSYLFPVLFAKVGSFSDKLKILKLNKALKKKTIDEIFNAPEKTTLEYLQNFGFSQQMIDRFFRPFFTGIFLETELRTSSRMFEFVYKMFGEGYATIPKAGIGAISEQLKNKLSKTTFQFNTAVSKIDGQQILLNSGETIQHEGAIVATEAGQIIENLRSETVKWKSCYCLYFEVDKTNIPPDTIALLTQPNVHSNNLYAYRDSVSGKKVLSVTVVKEFGGSMEELTAAVEKEIVQVAGCKKVDFIHAFHIKQALPELNNLRSDADPSESEVLPNVYLAGDYLFNGSLNAAMKSGQLAAKALIQKNQSWQG